MGKAKLGFIAKITTSDGKEILKRVVEDIPEDMDLTSIDGVLDAFDRY